MKATKGWQSLVYAKSNILRKVESDWHKAYLARTEESNMASITWKVDLKGKCMEQNEEALLR